MKRYQLVMAVLLVVPLHACWNHARDPIENPKVENVPHKTPETEPAGETAATTALVAPPEWSVRYSDGSNNDFHFWKDADGDTRFEYAPMTPELSSTGTYSGGSDKTGTVPEGQAKDLWSRVTTLEADPALHAKSRSMGTGSFTLTSGDKGERRFVVMGSALSEFNEFLKSYR